MDPNVGTAPNFADLDAQIAEQQQVLAAKIAARDAAKNQIVDDVRNQITAKQAELDQLRAQLNSLVPTPTTSTRTRGKNRPPEIASAIAETMVSNVRKAGTMTTKALGESVADIDTNINGPQVNYHLKKLVDAGRLVRTEHGVYSLGPVQIAADNAAAEVETPETPEPTVTTGRLPDGRFAPRTANVG